MQWGDGLASPEGLDRAGVCSEVPADTIDDRRLVEISVGVDPADGAHLVYCHAALYCPSNQLSRAGVHAPVGSRDKTPEAHAQRGQLRTADSPSQP